MRAREVESGQLQSGGHTCHLICTI